MLRHKAELPHLSLPVVNDFNILQQRPGRVCSKLHTVRACFINWFWVGRGFTGCGKTRVLTLVLKGRGFSRAVSAAKSMAALAAEGSRGVQRDFFRNLFSRASGAFRNASFSP
jgi:hypothetical protein